MDSTTSFHPEETSIELQNETQFNARQSEAAPRSRQSSIDSTHPFLDMQTSSLPAETLPLPLPAGSPSPPQTSPHIPIQDPWSQTTQTPAYTQLLSIDPFVLSRQQLGRSYVTVDPFQLSIAQSMWSMTGGRGKSGDVTIDDIPVPKDPPRAGSNSQYYPQAPYPSQQYQSQQPYFSSQWTYPSTYPSQQSSYPSQQMPSQSQSGHQQFPVFGSGTQQSQPAQPPWSYPSETVPQQQRSSHSTNDPPSQSINPDTGLPYGASRPQNPSSIPQDGRRHSASGIPLGHMDTTTPYPTNTTVRPVSSTPIYTPSQPIIDSATQAPPSPIFKPSSPTYPPVPPEAATQIPIYHPMTSVFNPTIPIYAPTAPAYRPTSPYKVYDPQPYPPYQTEYGLEEYLTAESSTTTLVIAFLFDTLPRRLYLYFLLGLPALYFSRVTRIFKEADMSMPEIKKMALEMPTQSSTQSKATEFKAFLAPAAFEPSIVPEPYKNLKYTWEAFIDSLMREWKTFNIISVLLLSAILTILQIESAAADPIARFSALTSLVCALVSLLYGCMYIIRFGGMRKTHKAAEWAFEAQKSRTSIFWNVWVLLAMPLIWLAWSILLYVVCIFCVIWRTGTNDDAPPIMTNHDILGPRIAISAVFGLGFLYFLFIFITFRRYGDAMDEAWSARVKAWIAEKANLNAVPPYRPMSQSFQPPLNDLSQYPQFGSAPPVKGIKIMDTRLLDHSRKKVNELLEELEIPQVIWSDFIADATYAWGDNALKNPSTSSSDDSERMRRVLSKWNSRCFMPRAAQIILRKEYHTASPNSPMLAIYLVRSIDVPISKSQKLIFVPEGSEKVELFDDGSRSEKSQLLLMDKPDVTSHLKASSETSTAHLDDTPSGIGSDAADYNRKNTLDDIPHPINAKKILDSNSHPYVLNDFEVYDFRQRLGISSGSWAQFIVEAINAWIDKGVNVKPDPRTRMLHVIKKWNMSLFYRLGSAVILCNDYGNASQATLVDALYLVRYPAQPHLPLSPRFSAVLKGDGRYYLFDHTFNEESPLFSEGDRHDTRTNTTIVHQPKDKFRIPRPSTS